MSPDEAKQYIVDGISQWRSSWLSREGVLAVVTYGPAGLFALSWVFLGDNGNVLGPVTAVLAAVSVSIGVLIERWLFFAEAKHVVILYYGAERA